ncbi:hypothetical protein GP486_003880 [Trichoglossum hirsutum]|uniref:Uncharacterized protein n=1 Tax=Trichoglossum hirsutum TaxID=265104 RepID=A0A9P8RQJ9_9PEZI|nr:hypothetical protein GP486_003880 [Trichoglossum hirsutum]
MRDEEEAKERAQNNGRLSAETEVTHAAADRSEQALRKMQDDSAAAGVHGMNGPRGGMPARWMPSTDMNPSRMYQVSVARSKVLRCSRVSISRVTLAINRVFTKAMPNKDMLNMEMPDQEMPNKALLSGAMINKTLFSKAILNKVMLSGNAIQRKMMRASSDADGTDTLETYQPREDCVIYNGWRHKRAVV